MSTAELGGSKAQSIQSFPLIHHLLLNGAVVILMAFFAEDNTKVWWVGGPTKVDWDRSC